jgi:molecular chaperone GrpE
MTWMEAMSKRRHHDEDQRHRAPDDHAANGTPPDPDAPLETDNPVADGDLGRGADADSEAALDDASQWRRRAEAAEKKALMYQADLENFRKRKNRETAEQLRFASLPLITSLISVLDNLERAVEAAQSGADANQPLLEGVVMVVNQLRDVLERNGCVRMESVGQPFDPTQHEAIQTQPGDEPNIVLQEVQPGYRMYDRVVRPARVIVSSGPRSGQN